jgi:cell division transport system ATP-binding protein
MTLRNYVDYLRTQHHLALVQGKNNAKTKPMDSIVVANKLSISFEQQKPVLSDISFRVQSGSFHFLTGPSGAGKSSLLRILYLMARPTGGVLEIFGKSISTLPRSRYPGIRRRMGVVFQDFRLLRHLSAMDNVALPLRLAGARKKEVRDHVEELLSWVGLSDRMDAFPDTLSGGEQQRVAIARAVVTKPTLLLADEPTGNVDDKMALRIMHLFEELNRNGTAVVIATHNQDIVKEFPHPQMHLEQGHLQTVPLSRK